MRFFRSQRVSNLIHEQLGEIMLREINFKGALATITDVEVDKNLEHAKIKISVIPSERGADVLEALGNAAGHLQHLLMKKVSIKPLPKIVFSLDHGYENAAQVEKKLMEE